MIRRTFLKGIGAGGVMTAAFAAGILKPGQVFAAQAWNRAAFEAKEMGAALSALGVASAADSKDIVLTAPEVAENGAVVPLGVLSNIPNTVSIVILSLKNPQPLLASFNFSNGGLPDVQLRVRLAETTNVRAIIKTADGKFFSAQKEVKVTAGGC
jgi:sulfur-oxidizing protein SoxY